MIDGPLHDGAVYEPMAVRVVRHVRQAILEGRFSPGSRIRQEELARELGTSRIPVREALRQLEGEGLVTLVPYSGARVSVMDFAEYHELYRLREVVEPMVIAESATRMTDKHLHRLRRLLAVFERSSADGLAWLESDRRFHLATYALAPLPRALDLIEGFWNQTQQYRRAYLHTIRRNLEPVDREHRLILEALESRDGENAASLQRMHIRRTRLTLAPHLELFDGRGS